MMTQIQLGTAFALYPATWRINRDGKDPAAGEQGDTPVIASIRPRPTLARALGLDEHRGTPAAARALKLTPGDPGFSAPTV